MSAGGVALNCVANGKILKSKIFKNVWIQPAAGDAGGSLGGALAIGIFSLIKIETSHKDVMSGSYLGPSYTDEQIKQSLDKIGAKYKLLDEQSLIDKTADDLSKGHAIGWFQGRMEFGPRTTWQINNW